METDIEKIVAKNGAKIWWKIKPGVVPTLEPRRTKRLREIEQLQEGFVETSEMVICEAASLYCQRF